MNLRRLFNPGLVVLAAIALPVAASAKITHLQGISKHHARGPASDPEPALVLVISFGEKVSEFRIKELGPKRLLEYQSNMGEVRTVELSRKNFNYLLSKARKIPIRSDVADQCYRTQAALSYKVGESSTLTSSCLGGDDPAARGLGELANLMAVML